MRITAADLKTGMTIRGINAYVVEVETSNGYTTYPSTGYGYDAAMPDDTVVVTFHDAYGEENYLLLSPQTPLDVTEVADF
jgi:hypothetical protein